MVCCAKCGFLALRHGQTRELREMGADYRTTGLVPHTGWDTLPLCFVNAFPLHDEIKATRNNDVKAVIDKERSCGRFTEWQQGYSPKEHHRMLYDVEMLRFQEERREKDRAHDDERRETERAFHVEQERSRQAFQVEQAQIDRRFRVKLTIATLVLGALVSAFVSTGSYIIGQLHGVDGGEAKKSPPPSQVAPAKREEPKIQ